MAHFQSIESFALLLVSHFPQKHKCFQGPQCTLNHKKCFKVANNLIKQPKSRHKVLALSFGGEKEQSSVSRVLATSKPSSSVDCDVQRCPSGLRCSPGKAVCEKLHQEFESLPLRQHSFKFVSFLQKQILKLLF